MTTTLAVDAKNDIYLDASGELAIVSGLQAVLQAAQQAVQTMLGEMILQDQDGMPNFNVIWSGVPNLQQFDAAIKTTLLQVTHVIGVETLSSEIIGDKVRYTVLIQTDFGQGTLNGIV